MSPPSPTVTPDPCSPLSLPEEVTKVNSLMREFDDYSELASNVPQAQLVQVIPDLQRVLRDAEDQKVPSCLKKLKEIQLAYMDVVVKTLMAFMAKSDIELINAGIGKGRQLHNAYELELARLLGITVIAPATSTPPAGTPTATVISSSTSVTNNGATSIILVAAPDTTAGGVAILEAGQTTLAFGKTADGKWIQVEVPGQPGQKAWVDATLVRISGELPLITP